MNAITLTALIIIFAGIVLSPFIVLAVIARMPDEEPRHTPDCLDWRRHGQRDITCTAHHGTDWFEPRTQVEFENALDGQLSIGEMK